MRHFEAYVTSIAHSMYSIHFSYYVIFISISVLALRYSLCDYSYAFILSPALSLFTFFQQHLSVVVVETKNRDLKECGGKRNRSAPVRTTCPAEHQGPDKRRAAKHTNTHDRSINTCTTFWMTHLS